MDGGTTRYACGDEERRATLLAARADGLTELNGIDFLEVLDRDLAGTPIDGQRQRILLLRCFATDGLDALTADHVRIEGGVRVTSVNALWLHVLDDVTLAGPADVPAVVRLFLVAFPAEERERTLVLGTDSAGDFSSYRLGLVEGAGGDLLPHSAFDPRLAAVDFSFKVECPSDFDCQTDPDCPPEALAEPAIDYLAKDYRSFRRLMLDRMSLLVPDWRERNPADAGIALVELLAYVGDRLSYFQDAAATEAYLGTARRRISVRRHARLVDYLMHEGANARAFVQLEVTAPLALPLGTRLLSGRRGEPTVVADGELAGALARETVFETLHPAELFPGHQELHLYTWDDRECCLPAGATTATLVGPPAEGGGPPAFAAIAPALEAGDLVLFEEVRGPRTGAAADADPAHRHVVRLTSVTATEDPLHGQPVLEVAWDAADALPFPLCVSARTDGDVAIDGVSVARGNVVAADHGVTLAPETLVVPTGERPFRPLLERGPVTHAVPLPADARERPAAAVLDSAPRDALPAVRLADDDAEGWQARRDLLASFATSSDFVAEIEDDGRARLRFGDGVHGRSPLPGTAFEAIYRAGNGRAGNVGAEALRRIARPAEAAFFLGPVTAVRNPLPATGGEDAEPLEQVRRFAPEAFRVQQRAVTADDYARAAERHPEVQRAAADFRWTGSWRTVFVTVDRRGGLPVDAAFEERLRGHLGAFRMAGYDLEIVPPLPLPLHLELQVCVAADQVRSDVAGELLERFSNRLLPGGGYGFFHADGWTFGQPVYLSRVVAAAGAVPGVTSVVVRRLQRLGGTEPEVPASGVFEVAPRQVVTLDNDPNFPDNGKLELELGGGR